MFVWRLRTSICQKVQSVFAESTVLIPLLAYVCSITLSTYAHFNFIVCLHAYTICWAIDLNTSSRKSLYDITPSHSIANASTIWWVNPHGITYFHLVVNKIFVLIVSFEKTFTHLTITNYNHIKNKYTIVLPKCMKFTTDLFTYRLQEGEWTYIVYNMVHVYIIFDFHNFNWMFTYVVTCLF